MAKEKPNMYMGHAHGECPCGATCTLGMTKGKQTALKMTLINVGWEVRRSGKNITFRCPKCK